MQLLKEGLLSMVYLNLVFEPIIQRPNSPYPAPHHTCSKTAMLVTDLGDTQQFKVHESCVLLRHMLAHAVVAYAESFQAAVGDSNTHLGFMRYLQRPCS